MINSIYPVLIQNGVATSDVTNGFDQVIIPYGAAATWISDVMALLQ